MNTNDLTRIATAVTHDFTRDTLDASINAHRATIADGADPIDDLAGAIVDDLRDGAYDDELEGDIIDLAEGMTLDDDDALTDIIAAQLRNF